MGFLDRIVRKAVSDVIPDKAADLMNQITGLGASQGRGRYPAQEAPYPQDPAYQKESRITGLGDASAHRGRNPYRDGYRGHEWFAGVLQSDFGEYLVREYVPVAELGGDGRPYDFLLVKNGAACLAIMVTEHNKTNNRAFRGARTACEAAGVPFMNFFDFMANEQDYVVDRIRKSLA